MTQLKNTVTFGELHDDALRAIFGHLSLPSLKAISLTNKRFAGLVTPLLFGAFDLTTRSPEDLDEVRQTLLKGSKARLVNHRFKTLTCEISELEEDDEADGDASESGGQSSVGVTIAAYLQFLAAVNSTETLALTTNLSSEPSAGVPLLPALARLGELAQRKADKVKLELLCEGLEDDDAPRHRSDGNARMIEQMLYTIPASLLSSLHLSGVKGSNRMTASALGDIINSFGNLTDLELTECLIDMAAWRPSGLKAFSLSCITEGSMQKSLPAAYGIFSASSQTLERITLHNTQGCRLQAKMPPEPLYLPQLRHLELADRDIGRGSLYALLLPAIKAPQLQYLDLDLVDIFTPDLSAVVTTIPTLKGLHLGQGLLRCESEVPSMPESIGFKATKLACANAGIDLKVTYTSELCQTPQELTDELARAEIVGDNLVTFSLGVTASAAPAFEKSQLLHLPKLTHLFMALVPPNEDSDGSPAIEDPDLLGRALGNIDAPLLQSLKLSISTGSKLDTLRAVLAELNEGHFSKLSVVGDEILQDQLQATPEHENSIRSAIFEVTTDSTSLRFIAVMNDEDDAAFTDDETIVDSDEDILGSSFGKLEIAE